MLVWIFAAAALAGTVELDNGTVITGNIGAWGEQGCAVVLDTGPLSGLSVQLPCERIVSYHRGRMDSVPVAVADNGAAPPVLVAPVVNAPDAQPALALPLAPPAPVAPPPPMPTAPPVIAVPPVAAVPAATEVPSVAEAPEEPRRRLLDALAGEWRGVKTDLGLQKGDEPDSEE